jgi:hypothetical protein
MITITGNSGIRKQQQQHEAAAEHLARVMRRSQIGCNMNHCTPGVFDTSHFPLHF